MKLKPEGLAVGSICIFFPCFLLSSLLLSVSLLC